MTRLLIVDDSPLMRRLVGEVFEAEGDFEIATARNGLEALAQLRSFAPDVITLDIHMPEMDGLTCLDRIMIERPTPVVMVSSLTSEGAEETLEAMSLGAVDFIAKPSGAVSLKMDELGPRLVERIRAAAQAKLPASYRLADRIRARTRGATAPPRKTPRAAARPLKVASPDGPVDRIVLVGTSTGGPPALDALLSPLPADFPWPILIAQHMPESFTGPLARRLDALCALNVLEVTRPTVISPGHVYIGRGDADLILSLRAGGLSALAAPARAEYRWHPSVDRLVESAMALVPAERLVGVLMTGMGADGAAAMTELRKAGGATLAEAEATAVVWGMPGELVKAGGAQIVAPLGDLADHLVRLTGRS